MKFETTEVQKERFENKSNDTLKIYDALIKSVNTELNTYKNDYLSFSNNIITLNHFLEKKEMVTSNIKNLSQKTFVDMIELLNKIKADYIKECFPVKKTTDTIELDFISKELEVMSENELIEFLNLNFLDENKVRLFDIELKRRKKNNEKVYNLEELRLKEKIEDKLTLKIDNQIKLYNGCRQILDSTFALFSLNLDGTIKPQLLAYKELYDYVEMQCRYNKSINVIELIK